MASAVDLVGVGVGGVLACRAKKMGPSGPRALLVVCWTGPRRYLLEVSIFRCRLRGRTRVHAPSARDAMPTIAEEFCASSAAFLPACRAGLRAASRRLAGARRARRSSNIAAEPLEHVRGGAQVLRGDVRERLAPSAPARPRAWPRSCAGPAGVSRETTTRRSVSERARSTWPRLGEVVEHLRDRRRRQPRRRARARRPSSSPRSSSSISSSNWAWLSSDAAEVRVAAAQAADGCGTRGGTRARARSARAVRPRRRGRRSRRVGVRAGRAVIARP